MPQYADIYLLLNYSICFGCPSRPSSGVHKTVVAASGTDLTIWGASFLKRDQLVTFEEDSGTDHTIWEASFLKRDQLVTFEEDSGTDHTIWGSNFLKRDQLVTVEEACSQIL